MEKIRIQKIMSDSGVCSRRKAEEYISEGRVKVNGRPCKLGDKAFAGKDITKQFYTYKVEKSRKNCCFWDFYML